MTSLRYLILLMIVSAFAGCKKDDSREISSLEFPSDVYYVSEGSEFYLHINQGNKQYDLVPGDGSVISARADDTAWPAGAIFVTGLKKGSTVLSVTDRATGQKADLTVHVVDPYLLLRLDALVPAIKVPLEMPEATREIIRDEAAKYGTLKLNQVLILQTADQEFSLFENREDLHAGNIKNQGHYRLAATGERDFQLILEFAGNEKTLSFLVSTQNQYAVNLLSRFADEAGGPVKFSSREGRGIDPSDIHGESPIVTTPLFMLRADLTSKFKPDYPEIDFVWLTQRATWWDNVQDYGKIGDGVLN